MNSGSTTFINIQEVRNIMGTLREKKEQFNRILDDLRSNVSETVGTEKWAGQSAEDFRTKWNSFENLFSQYVQTIESGAVIAEGVAQNFTNA